MGKKSSKNQSGGIFGFDISKALGFKSDPCDQKKHAKKLEKADVDIAGAKKALETAENNKKKIMTEQTEAKCSIPVTPSTVTPSSPAHSPDSDSYEYPYSPKEPSHGMNPMHERLEHVGGRRRTRRSRSRKCKKRRHKSRRKHSHR